MLDPRDERGSGFEYFIGAWPKVIEPCRVMDLVVGGGVADDCMGRLTVVRADITCCPAATERYGITGAPSYVLLRRERRWRTARDP